MKKFMFILVVLSVVLMGCPGPVDDPVVEPPIDDRFEGAWISQGTSSQGTSSQGTSSQGTRVENILQFSSSSFIYKYNNLSGIGEFSGTFTFTETTITFSVKEGIDNEELYYMYTPWTTNYRITYDFQSQPVWLNMDYKTTDKGDLYFMGGAFKNVNYPY